MKEEINKLRIKEWAESDRPREKMVLHGAASLTNAELLAILISSGSSRETAVELAQRILHNTRNNLHLLGKLSIKELIANFNGIGPAKAVTIVAALELGKRRGGSEQPLHEVINSSYKSYLLFYPHLCDLPHEELWVALLNRANKVIEKVKISQGGICETSADIRLILKYAINSLASSVILCHNHPSGNSTPSAQDNALTRRLTQSCSLMDIQLADHIILCDGHYYSYADEEQL